MAVLELAEVDVDQLDGLSVEVLGQTPVAGTMTSRGDRSGGAAIPTVGGIGCDL
jgi:hypothetical protein